MAGPHVEATFRRLLLEIEKGVYAPGMRLPSERVLAAEIGASRATLRAALGRLADNGMIESSAQRGWYVRSTTLGEPPSTLQSFSEMAWARGLRPTARILLSRRRTATLDESRQLGIAPASSLFELRRVRGLDGVPVCVDITRIPLPQGEALVGVDLTDQSLYNVLAELCGIQIHRSAYSVQAEAAEADIAKILDIEPSSPVLVGYETAYDRDGVPLLLGHATYRGEAYRFEADLFRTLGGV